jgi:hypothetical protein
MPDNTDWAAEVQQAEQARCAALLNEDWQSLAALLSEDLVHIHANGGVDDKQSYLRGVSTQAVFLDVTRENLLVRIHGITAIVTGRIHQSLRLKTDDRVMMFSGLVTQIWVRHGQFWQQASFHAVHLPQ